MLTNSLVQAIAPTRDIGRTRPFYEDTLGLSPVEERPEEGSVLFEAGEGSQLLLYQTEVDVPAAHTVLAFRVDDVPAAVEGLESRDVKFKEYDMSEYGFEGSDAKQKIIDLPGESSGQGAFFTDPEGNIIGLYSR